MSYVELMGFPGSGKTTLLRSFRRQETLRAQVRILLSDERRLCREHFGKLWLLGNCRYHTGFFAPRLKHFILDSWHAGTLDSYPEVFQRVIECLRQVPKDNRQRSIVLNYWQSRMRIFGESEQQSGANLTLVDEGLSQAIFSTMRRMEGDAGRIRLLTQELIRSLPENRVIVYLRTPAELVDRRNQSLNAENRQHLAENREKFEFLVAELRALGLSIHEMDGSNPMDKKMRHLAAILGTSI